MALDDNIPEFVSNSQFGDWIRELDANLRAATEDQRVVALARILREMSERKLRLSLVFDVAKRTVRKRESFAQLLRVGLQVADATTIKEWLAFSVAQLGYVRVIEILESLPVGFEAGISKAAYWLPAFAANEAEAAMAERFTSTLPRGL
jgi:hypothetical protein